MEVVDLIRTVIKMLDWFPCTLVGLITFPVNIILKFIIDNPGIENLLDFVLIDVFDSDWRRRELVATS